MSLPGEAPDPLWRRIICREKEATQNANSDLGARMEEALKVERAAGKEATKHGKRADKAEEECRRSLPLPLPLKLNNQLGAFHS